MTNSFGYPHIFALICAAIVMWFFVLSGAENWEDRYTPFSVPAHSYPGGDARNIQLTAHCGAISASQSEFANCYERAESLRSLYPEIVIPTYNYPSVWAKAYALFGNNSEAFFMGFWRLNAGLLMLTLLLLSVRYAPLTFPVFAFSPITLLTIERGNIDAATFFLTFMPLLLVKGRPFITALFFGLAAAAKIFPLFAFVAFLHPRFWKSKLMVLLGLAVAAPLVVVSLLEIPVILAETTKSFRVSYGLSSLLRAPYFWGKGPEAIMLMGAYVLVLVSALAMAWRQGNLSRLKAALGRLNDSDLLLLCASASIFMLTFLVFNNWSYRLIFLIPSFMVLVRVREPLAQITSLLIGILFWLPMLPGGWELQNIACFPISILLGVIMVSTLRQRGAG